MLAFRINVVSASGALLSRNDIPKESNVIVKESTASFDITQNIGSTKNIAEALNVKITQLKAKYSQLANSIKNSPNKKKQNAGSKENAPIPAKTGERKLRRHNSQENIEVHSKIHRTIPSKGILKQSLKPNVEQDPLKKELFPHQNQAKQKTSEKQSIASLVSKRILEQAREKEDNASKQAEVVRNVNDRTLFE